MHTATDIEIFQADNRDWKGEKLVVDGIAGPKTRWARAVSEQDAIRRAVIRRFCSHVGLRELGVNRHALIDQWNKRAGAPLGSPWCASYASWALSCEGAPEVKCAGAVRLGRMFDQVDGQLANAGDLFWFHTTIAAGSGHIGGVVGSSPCGAELAVVEGNSMNQVRIVRRLVSEGHLARPFKSYRGPHVPLPLGLELVRVGGLGTR